MHKAYEPAHTRRGSRKTLALLAGVALGAIVATDTPANAQAPTAADLERLFAVIEAQQQQIDALRAEVNAMRTAAATPRAAAAPAPAAAPQATVAAAPATAAAPGGGATTEAQIVEEGFVFRDQSGRTLEISGQFNPAFNVVDDGVETNVFIVDNDTSSSRIRFDATMPLDQTVFGGTFELGLSPNNSFDVSQIDKNVDADFNVRKAEVAIGNDRYGTFKLGKGSSAADDVAEYDLSLVAGPIMYSGVGDIAGGIIFTDGEDYLNVGTPDDPDYVTVGGSFFNFDPGRLSRVRYDTPMFGPVQGAISYGEEDQWAVAATVIGADGDGYQAGDFTLLGAFGFYGDEDDNIDYTYAGSFSILHNPTGLSLTLSAGSQEVDEGDTPSNLYGKLAWDTQFWAIGATGFGIDYTEGNNVFADGYDGQSWGLAAVQTIDRFSIDLYAQIRQYDLDVDTGPEAEDITVGTFGTKFTF